MVPEGASGGDEAQPQATGTNNRPGCNHLLQRLLGSGSVKMSRSSTRRDTHAVCVGIADREQTFDHRPAHVLDRRNRQNFHVHRA